MPANRACAARANPTAPHETAWLEDQCIAYARRTSHPEFKDRTIWEVFQDERASLMELQRPRPAQPRVRLEA